MLDEGHAAAWAFAEAVTQDWHSKLERLANNIMPFIATKLPRLHSASPFGRSREARTSVRRAFRSSAMRPCYGRSFTFPVFRMLARNFGQAERASGFRPGKAR